MGRVQEMQTKIKSNIQEKLRKYQDKDKAMIQELEEEITHLQRKHSELEELSQSDDNLHLLQVIEPASILWGRQKRKNGGIEITL